MKQTIKGLALFLIVMFVGVLAIAAGPESAATTAPSAISPLPAVRLKAISSRVTGKGASVLIEATEPTPYVASRPDALTLLIDFRDVSIEGVANSFAGNIKSPITAVEAEPGEAGGNSSRVRVTLAEPVAHRVRAERNTVVIEFDKKSAPFVLPPASRLSATADPIAAMPRTERRTQDPIATLGLDTPEGAKTEKIDARLQVAELLAQAGGAAGRQPQPPVPPPAPAIQTTLAQGQRRFTGNAVSLDFQGADLRAVLRTFSEISGLNIVIDPAVSGTVDVALRDVPWDQALDIILRANKLGYLVDGTIVRIAPITTLSEEESQRRKLSEEQALAGELRVLTKTLSYAKADDLQALLTKSALSLRGTVQVDTRTNTIIITDLPDRLTTAGDLINTLDKAQPQVEIEARIVQVNKNFERRLGIQWGFNGRVDPALGNTTNLAFPNSGTLSGTAGQGGQAVNLGVPGAPSAAGLHMGSVNGAFNLDVAISALESSGNGRVLSTPRIATQNNVEAEITQGTQIPIQTVANNTVTVSFKDAALTLKVTPQITAANTVIMKISLENGQADFGRAVNGIPPINTQRANTSVLVSDGQTTVIGGIYLSTEQYQTDRTPGLGRIPILSWLFKRDSAIDTSSELLIFITPKIVKL